MRHQVLHPHTAVINKQQKNKSKQARLDALQWLAKQFPIVFDTTSSIRPLKKGIMADILAYEQQAVDAGVSRSKLRQSIASFTRRIDYLTCLKAREMRIDLNGNPVEEVSVEEAERASMKLRKRIEKSAKNSRRNVTTSQPRFTLDSTICAFDNLNTQKSAKPVAITIKNKVNRAFDPQAVARLKAKLGIGAKQEDSVE